MCTCVPTWSTCQRTCMPAWFTCQRACIPTSQRRANVPCLRANGPWMCQRAYSVPMFYSTCQRAKWRANFLTWRANVPKRMPTFQAFLLRNARGNFCTLLLYKKFSIILDIIVIHIVCICNVHKHCIILHFYTSCHIKEKYVNLFFFIIFFSFLLFS